MTADKCLALLSDGTLCVLPIGHCQSEPGDDHENEHGVSLMEKSPDSSPPEGCLGFTEHGTIASYAPGIKPPGGQAEIRVRLTDTAGLTEALHGAIDALNRNGFVTRSAALYDLAEAVTRHLGLEWNPYGQTMHPRPDGLGMDITRDDEDIRP